MKLRYTLPALADLSAILDYIAAQSPQGARRVQARIQAVTELLSLYPLIGRQTNDPTIRRMMTTPYPYIIFYEATGTESIIHAIRHAARDPSSMAWFSMKKSFVSAIYGPGTNTPAAAAEILLLIRQHRMAA